MRGNASDSIIVSNSAVLGNWIENELIVQDSSGYADNVIDGVVTVGQKSQPIGCNLIGGNLVCPEGRRGTGSERTLRSVRNLPERTAV